MTLRHVRLELARTADQPQGSIHCGYELNIPLNIAGHFDEGAWEANREQCTVRRFWDGEDDESGTIERQGDRWVFSYDPTTEDDDEPMFRLAEHRFVPGEYLSITEHDGVQRTFRVVYVR